MANYKWPNVYPSIKDASGTLATNSVTTCAYVGEAEFGPINKPTFLSSLKDYTNKFGALNSAKYGYAGYSLAVASESINSHYFVRVVKAGDPNAQPKERTDDAMYASAKVPAKGKEAEAGCGWYVEEIAEIEKTEDGSGLFKNDTNNAMIVLANNPNNLKFKVQLSNTTINENRAYPFSRVDYQQIVSEVEDITSTKSGDTYTSVVAKDSQYTLFEVKAANEVIDPDKYTVDTTTGVITFLEATPGAETTVTIQGKTPKYIATMTGAPQEVLDVIEVGDDIELTRVAAQAGIYTVTAKDANAKTLGFVYTAASADPEHKPVDLKDGGKVSKYPEPSERTFQVDVKQVIGRTEPTLETYQYCTLYAAKDNFGNSTFVEDVVNGKSDYIKIYVNPTLLAEAEANDTVLEFDINASNLFELVGGRSGGHPTSKELNAGWDLFEDRNQTSVSLLLNSGYSDDTDISYQQKMLNIAEKRRDCFCLFDVPMSEVEPEDAIDWRKNILGMNSYYGALSSPWVKTYDSIQGRAGFVMCPSAFIAKLIGQAGDPWNAPAGPNRGIIGSSTVSPTGLTQTYDSNVGGKLYADNQINCLIRDVSAGYVNWGQRTLQAKPSALDRINVARTVIYIETILRDAARWHLFENNTPYERMQIVLKFSQFLDTILSADGITSYKVICDESNNTPLVIQNNQLVIDVILQPVYTAESIILNTTVTSTDASVVTTTANL